MKPERTEKIHEEEWSIANQIMEQHLTEIAKEQEISIWQIDVALYVSAITLLGRHSELRETRREKENIVHQAGRVTLRIV